MCVVGDLPQCTGAEIFFFQDVACNIKLTSALAPKVLGRSAALAMIALWRWWMPWKP